MAHFSEEGKAGRPLPEPPVFRAMLAYIDLFAERIHHPKEERRLFPVLRQRSAEAARLLDRLELEHSRGASAIRALEQAFVRWEEGGQPYFGAFAKHVAEFTGFYRQHLRAEETELLPLAQRVLTADDWRVVDESFAEGEDPLEAEGEERDLRHLFTHVAAITPAPLGFGEPLRSR
jgi:hemerythrin-like domain-containing protein